MFKKNQIDLGDQIKDLLTLVLRTPHADIEKVDADNVLTAHEKKMVEDYIEPYMIAVLYMLVTSDQQARQIEGLDPRKMEQEEANSRMSYWFGFYCPIVLSEKIGKAKALEIGEDYVQNALHFLEESLVELEGKQVTDKDIFFAIAHNYAAKIVPGVKNVDDGYRQHVVFDYATQVYRIISDIYKKSLKGSKLVYHAPE